MGSVHSDIERLSRGETVSVGTETHSVEQLAEMAEVAKEGGGKIVVNDQAGRLSHGDIVDVVRARGGHIEITGPGNQRVF